MDHPREASATRGFGPILLTVLLATTPCLAGSWGDEWGFFTWGSPTAIILVSFEADGGPDGVDLTWVTAQETDNAGFHLHRSDDASGPWVRLNADIIPGQGTVFEPTTYTWSDGPLEKATYWYRLEDVSLSGGVQSHGPISAKVGAGCAATAGPGGSIAGLLVVALGVARPGRRRRTS